MFTYMCTYKNKVTAIPDYGLHVYEAISEYGWKWHRSEFNQTNSD